MKNTRIILLSNHVERGDIYKTSNTTQSFDFILSKIK